MTEEYKKGKVPEIVREFDNTGNKYEINGIDQSKCKFFWRKENDKFQIINSGSYRITQEGGTYYLLIEDDEILTNATQFQICYFFEQQSSKYLDKFPELSIAVNKINDLVEDVKNIFSYLKSTGVTGDTSTMSKVLSELEEQCVWWLNNGRIESLPITEMYSKFDRLVEQLRQEVLKLLEQDLEVAERELLKEVKRQLDEYVKTDLKQRLDDYTTQLEERLQTMIDQAVADKGLMPEGSDWLEIGLGNWLVVDLFNKNYIHYPPQLNSSDNAGVVKKDITDGGNSQVIRFYTTTGKMLFIVRVNEVWSEWQELGGQTDKMQFTQPNHEFVFTAVTLDGATRKWVKANKYTSADGIAIKIDNDRFDVVTRGVVNIPTQARDDKGEPFVYDEYYFLSQEVDGGFSRTKNEVGTFQYLAHISEIDNKQVAYIDIGDSYDLDYEVVDTETAKRIGLLTKNDIVNDLTTGGTDKAGSAEMVKKLGEDKQNKTDNELETNSKKIVGAINESLWRRIAKELPVTDLNLMNAQSKGVYYKINDVQNILNRPVNDSENFYVEWSGFASQTGILRYWSWYSKKVYRKYRLTNGTWTPWQEELDSGSSLFLGNAGITSVVYIQDAGSKTRGNGYIDKTTGKLYLCYPKDESVDTVNDVTVTKNFTLATNIANTNSIVSSKKSKYLGKKPVNSTFDVGEDFRNYKFIQVDLLSNGRILSTIVTTTNSKINQSVQFSGSTGESNNLAIFVTFNATNLVTQLVRNCDEVQIILTN